MNKEIEIESTNLSNDKDVSIEYKDKMLKSLQNAINNLEKDNRMTFIIVTRINNDIIGESYGNMKFTEVSQSQLIMVETITKQITAFNKAVANHGK